MSTCTEHCKLLLPRYLFSTNINPIPTFGSLEFTQKKPAKSTLRNVANLKLTACADSLEL